MPPKLPHTSPAVLAQLAPGDLLLAYRNPGDYESNTPDHFGVIELIHEGNPGAWDIKYRTTPSGARMDGLININDMDYVLLVSGPPTLVGQK